MARGSMPDALQQVWDLLRLAPANYRRAQIACGSIHAGTPGVSFT